MEIEEAFTSYLLTNAQLWADVVTWADTELWDETKDNLVTLISNRFYPDELPQGTSLPAVSYIKVSDIKDHTLQGQAELENPIFQFTVFSYTKSNARAAANQIKKALKDFTGTMGEIEIQKIALQNEISNLETSPDGTVKVFTEALEFQINFIRS